MNTLGKKEILLDKNIMIVSEMDENSKIIYANSDFCKISGYIKDELIGNPYRLVSNSFMPKSVIKDLWDTVKKGLPWNGIVINSTKEGNYYWVNTTVYSSKQVNGQIRYVSVRTKPTKEEIDYAINIYPTLK